jgi:hypothetical protein
MLMVMQILAGGRWLPVHDYGPLVQKSGGTGVPGRGHSRVKRRELAAFAIACRWVSDLTVVFNEGREPDLMPPHMENFNGDSANIQLRAMGARDLEQLVNRLDRNPAVAHPEPPVPYQEVSWSDYRCHELFDSICLAHSPKYTPIESDTIFYEIRWRFILE